MDVWPRGDTQAQCVATMLCDALSGCGAAWLDGDIRAQRVAITGHYGWLDAWPRG
jgi:hypothetical protein